MYARHRATSPTRADQETSWGGRVTAFAPTARAKPSEGAKTASWKSSAVMDRLPARSSRARCAGAEASLFGAF